MKVMFGAAGGSKDLGVIAARGGCRRRNVARIVCWIWWRLSCGTIAVAFVSALVVCSGGSIGGIYGGVGFIG